MHEKIFDNVYKLDIPLPNNPLRNLNSYLICGEHRNLLIDTGFRQDACREALLRELHSLNVDMEKTDIFLTHFHADHSGLAVDIKGEYSKIYVSNMDRQLIMRYLSDSQWRAVDEHYIKEGFSRDELDALWNNNPAKNYSAQPYYQYVGLNDGEELCYGGYHLQCVMTAGHTPGHMCLYIPEKKAMFLGDHILFKITPNITRWDGVADSLGDYLANLDKIGGYDIAVPLPSHRQVLCSVEERIGQLKEHHKVRVAEAYAAILAHPGSNAYQIAGHMSWDIRCKSWADFPATQRWFAVGEAMSHIDYLLVRGKITRTEDKRGVHYFAKD